MERDGLVEIKDRSIRVLPMGRLLVRNVAMTFDQYLPKKKELRFSRTI